MDAPNQEVMIVTQSTLPAAAKSDSKTDDEWKPVLDKYEVQRIIGQGAYGKVVKARSRATSERVAIKKQTVVLDDLYSVKKILREFSLLKQF